MLLKSCGGLTHSRSVREPRLRAGTRHYTPERMQRGLITGTTHKGRNPSESLPIIDQSTTCKQRKSALVRNNVDNRITVNQPHQPQVSQLYWCCECTWKNNLWCVYNQMQAALTWRALHSLAFIILQESSVFDLSAINFFFRNVVTLFTYKYRQTSVSQGLKVA